MSPHKINKPNWTMDVIKKFIDVLMEMTLCSDVKELKDHIIIESVWHEVEKKLDIDQESLKRLWYNCLHLQLFCSEPIYMNDIMIKLIECLYIEKVSHLQGIEWNKVARRFDGVTVIFLRNIFYKLIQVVKDRTKIKNLREMISYLYDEYIPLIVSNERDKILPRLKYNEGNISYIDANIENQDITNESMDDRE